MCIYKTDTYIIFGYYMDIGFLHNKVSWGDSMLLPID